MGNALAFLALLFCAGLIVGIIVWGVFLMGESPRAKFTRQCIIDNKELPRPDLYCDALWQQSQYGNGGR